MNFGQAIASCMGKYATFSGRASRSEFWWFYLFVVLMSWASQVTGAAIFASDPELTEILPTVVNLVLLLPGLAAASRRLHDTGRSGWWQLLYFTIIGIILLIVWWARGSQQEDNKYGPWQTEPSA